MSQWLPALASALGAMPPYRLPAWLRRLAIGEQGLLMMTQSRGASNAKAKQQLGWRSRFTSWASGFRDGLDADC